MADLAGPNEAVEALRARLVSEEPTTTLMEYAPGTGVLSAVARMLTDLARSGLGPVMVVAAGGELDQWRQWVPDTAVRLLKRSDARLLATSMQSMAASSFGNQIYLVDWPAYVELADHRFGGATGVLVLRPMPRNVAAHLWRGSAPTIAKHVLALGMRLNPEDEPLRTMLRGPESYARLGIKNAERTVTYTDVPFETSMEERALLSSLDQIPGWRVRRHMTRAEVSSRIARLLSQDSLVERALFDSLDSIDQASPTEEQIIGNRADPLSATDKDLLNSVLLQLDDLSGPDPLLAALADRARTLWFEGIDLLVCAGPRRDLATGAFNMLREEVDSGTVLATNFGIEPKNAAATANQVRIIVATDAGLPSVESAAPGRTQVWLDNPLGRSAEDRLAYAGATASVIRLIANN